MSEAIKILNEEINTMHRRLEDGVSQLRKMQKKLQIICPHKWKDGFMYSECEWCGAES